MALSSLSKRVTALEPLPASDWGEFLDTLDDAELERLDGIVFKLNPDGQPTNMEMTEAEADAHFGVLTQEELSWYIRIVERKTGTCLA